jgi:hypothetical protein
MRSSALSMEESKHCILGDLGVMAVQGLSRIRVECPPCCQMLLARNVWMSGRKRPPVDKETSGCLWGKQTEATKRTTAPSLIRCAVTQEPAWATP